MIHYCCGAVKTFLRLIMVIMVTLGRKVWIWPEKGALCWPVRRFVGLGGVITFRDGGSGRGGGAYMARMEPERIGEGIMYWPDVRARQSQVSPIWGGLKQAEKSEVMS